MQFDVIGILGLSGSTIRLGQIDVTPAAISIESTYAGSYHILEMGAHFTDYVVAPHFPSLPMAQQFPANHPFVRSADKIRAGGVTGNLGEAMASLFARQVLLLQVFDIAHIRPNQPYKKRKAPDYLMRIPRMAPGVAALLPQAISTVPNWWPVESKARANATSARNAHREALRQLGAYWHTIHVTHANDVGFGVSVCMTYSPPASITFCVFAPSNQAALLTRLRTTTYQRYVDDFSHDSATKGALYG